MTEALANRERWLRRARLAGLLAVAGGITILTAGWSALEDPTTGSWITTLGGVVTLLTGAVLTTYPLARVRYRIATPYAGLVLAAKVAGALGVFVGLVFVANAIGVPPLSRRFLVVALVAGLGWVVNDHTVRSTLFQADATGVRFGRVPVAWPAITQLVVAPGAAPDVVEVSATLVDGTPAPPDGPSVVPADRLDWRRLAWAVSQSGRSDLPLVTRDSRQQAEMGHHPPPTNRRMWLVAGGIGLTVVLVASAITALVLTTSVHTTAETSTPVAAYSATSITDGCATIDVYVLKPWSTVPRITTESHRFASDHGDKLTCRAYSDSQYVVGRVVSLDLEITVAADATAATSAYREAKDSGLWSAQGDVTEKGDVPKLGEVAEYEASIWPMGGTTRTTYVLTIRDANMALLLRLNAESDQSDGAGAGVGTFADTAAAQAKAAMAKLRAAAVSTGPTSGRQKPRSAPLPKTANDAAVAETTGPLMARVRAADPCELLDRDYPQRFGTSVAEEPKQAQSFDECQLLASTADPAAPRVRFRLSLAEWLTAEERAKLTPDTLHGQEVFRDPDSATSNTCSYYLPYGTTGFGAQVYVNRHIAGNGSDQAPWPEACATAKEYASLIAPAVTKLPPRSHPASEPTLAGKDPCAIADAVVAKLGDWKRGPISRFIPTGCQFDVHQGKESYEIHLDFDHDAEQLGDEPVTIAGLTGTRINSYADSGMCSVSLVYVPETTPDAWDAHDIQVAIQRDPGWQGTGSLDPCQVTTMVAELQVAKVG